MSNSVGRLEDKMTTSDNVKILLEKTSLEILSKLQTKC